MTPAPKISILSSSPAKDNARKRVRSLQGKRLSVGICGVGLIGGSIAERLKRVSRETRIIGYDKKQTLRTALAQGVIDNEVSSPTQMLSECDIIVLSAPPSVNQSLLKRLSHWKGESDSLIIDTGSTQTAIASLARDLEWRNAATFVAGHPMAGKERGGLSNRSAGLFAGHPFFLDRAADISDIDAARVFWLTRKLGADAQFVDSGRHDRVMADVSHLPQLVSTVMANLVLQYDSKTINLAGTGLQSMIRLGGSPYDIWGDVFTENRWNVKLALDVLISDLEEARNALENNTVEKTFRAWFRKAKRSYRCLW